MKEVFIEREKRVRRTLTKNYNDQREREMKEKREMTLWPSPTFNCPPVFSVTGPKRGSSQRVVGHSSLDQLQFHDDGSLGSHV